mgnify:CR=1 FL=1
MIQPILVTETLDGYELASRLSYFLWSSMPDDELFRLAEQGRLRQELAAGSINGALILLWECFGLQGLESIAALQSLRTHLSVAAPVGPEPPRRVERPIEQRLDDNALKARTDIGDRPGVERFHPSHLRALRYGGQPSHGQRAKVGLPAGARTGRVGAHLR